MSIPPLPLTSDGRLLRVIVLVLATLLALCTLLTPGLLSFASTDLMRDVVGLPCPFCGGTRAMHCLLAGDWRSALYFNWLAFPVLLGGLGLIVVLLWELLAKHKISHPFKVNRRWMLLLACFLGGSWFWHIFLALSIPKPELLNANGLFFQFVSFPSKGYISGTSKQDAGQIGVSGRIPNPPR